ncbi:MAG: Signal recognition particle 54 kDa protein [Holosporales bacterium]
MGQAEFIGKTLKEAIEKTKQVLGEDAFILHSEETKDGIKVIATNDENDATILDQTKAHPNGKNIYAVTRNTLQEFKKTIKEDQSPIDVIRSIIDVCSYQGLSTPFCDSWLNALAPDFKKDRFYLDDALEKIIPFNDHWIRSRSPEQPIILVGPSGGGKTAIAGKLLLILKSLKKNVQVVTLDTQKAGAISQLSQYLAPFAMNLEVGHDGYLKAKKECITKDQILIVDTPGVNILSKEGQTFFYKLSEKLRDPLTVVLPNDMRGDIMSQMAHEFKTYNAKYIIGTRFDVDRKYGGFFTTIFENQLEPVLYSDDPKISNPLHIINSEKTLSLLTSI